MRSRSNGLPISRFSKVKQVITRPFVACIYLIVDNPAAGSRDMFDVVTLKLRLGTMRTIGRELPLSLARKVARGTNKEK